MRRIALLGVLIAIPVLLAAAPAGACGGLVGENGTIQLTRTSTLAAYHDGDRALRDELRVHRRGRRGGLDRAAARRAHRREAGRRLDAPAARAGGAAADAAEAFAAAGTANVDSAKAQVILETKIDALDITVLKGGGEAVGKWALDHGFLLTPDAPRCSTFYAQRSPIFMAARFDASRARELGQTSGDGTPIMLTIPTDEPWVPLRILALGLDSAKVVDADVFLLTDDRPTLRAGGVGLELARSDAGVGEPARRPALRQGHGLGARQDVVQLPARRTPRRRTSTTTSRCRPACRCVAVGTDGGHRSPRWSRAVAVVAGLPGVAGQRDRRRAARRRDRARGARTAPVRRGRVMRLTGSRRAAAIGALAFVFAVAAFGVVAVTQSGGASGDAFPACSVPGR